MTASPEPSRDAPRGTTPPVVFTPPGPALTTRPTIPPPPAVATMGPPRPPDAPPPTPVVRRRIGRGAAIGIVAGAVAFCLLLGGVVWGATQLAGRVHTALPHRLRDAPPSASGPRTGTRWATTPMACATACLAGGAALAPPEHEVDALGMPIQTDNGAQWDGADPASEYHDAMVNWEHETPVGDDCMFTESIDPVDAKAGDPPADDGSLAKTIARWQSTDRSSEIDFGERDFADSSTAESHMHRMQDRIAACRQVITTAEDDRWNGWVNALQGWVALPADVTALGWVEGAPGTPDYLGVELQRGNVVLRISYGASQETRAEFQETVLRAAERLEALPPTPAGSTTGAP